MIAVFCGPTISAEAVQAMLPAQCFAPAARGDLYRVARENRPRAIGLIDGYFQGALSVWHKEILWAMAQGVHVFGASSMGALRAAELHAFGMHGVGQVFEAYRNGVLEDDDEVALVHGPPETGYAALSEPLVNIRATLDAALKAEVVDGEFVQDLLTRAKQMFYQELTWDRLCAAPELADRHVDQNAALQHWLPDNRVDAKRDDAVEMLNTIPVFLRSEPAPCEVGFNFERTHLWDDVVQNAADEATEDEFADGVSAQDLLAALRLDPDLHDHLRRLALGRIAAADPEGAPHTITERDLRGALTEFRQQNDLLTAREFAAWLEQRCWSEHSLRRRLAHDLSQEALARTLPDALDAEILEQLKTSAEFDDVLARAKSMLLTTEAV